MSGLIFLAEDASEGGYTACALGQPTFNETDSLSGLHTNIREAVECYFDEGQAPLPFPFGAFTKWVTPYEC